MSATLCKEHNLDRNPIKPVFFAPTDIQPGGLTEELQERLKASRNLIVICSPNSAQSEWVGKEIEFFHRLGRTKQIHFFIIDGEPHSANPATECFNSVVNTLGLPEILGANIHEKTFRWSWMNKERAYVQLISKLLGVEFDTIWQRHRRLLIQEILCWIVGIACVFAVMIGVWLSSQPVDVEVQLNEASVHNPNLPPLKDAIVTIVFDNEVKTDTMRSIENASVFTNIPKRFMKKDVRIKVECNNFLPVDTIVLLTEAVSINIRRNPDVYGMIRFKLWNPKTDSTYPNIQLSVDGHKTETDSLGNVMLFIPLESQKQSYSVKASHPFIDDIFAVPNSVDAIIEVK